MKSVVSQKGRVTIPRAIRERLGIVTGTELAFAEDRGRLVAVIIRGGDPISRWRGRGRLPGVRTVDEYLKMVRG
jgi:AbrB family looped-hinge helix DNA binding protein